MDESFFSRPSLLLKSLSRRSHTPTPSPPSLLKSSTPLPTSDTSGSTSGSQRGASRTEIPSLSRSISRVPILFSQSSPQRKAPTIEKKLECTLEELCHGCVKQIMMTRDVIRSGYVTLSLTLLLPR